MRLMRCIDWQCGAGGVHNSAPYGDGKRVGIRQTEIPGPNGRRGQGLHRLCAEDLAMCDKRTWWRQGSI